MAHEYIQEQQERRIQSLEVGDRFITNQRVVSQGNSESWTSMFGLTHPLFLNDEYARKMGFNNRLVSGIFTFTLMMGLLYQSGIIRDGIYLGTENSEYPVPVYPGDMLKAEIEILGKRTTSKGDRVIVKFKWLVRNQSEEVVAKGGNAEMVPASS